MRLIIIQQAQLVLDKYDQHVYNKQSSQAHEHLK